MTYWENRIPFIDGENWHDIPNHEGQYQFSDLGRIRSLDRKIPHGNRVKKGYILKQKPDKDGYIRISLCKNGIKYTYKVHRIVGYAIPNPFNLPQVNHKKGIKSDNRLSELEWSTISDNIKHAYDNLGKITPMKGKFGKDCPNSKKIKCETLDIIYDSATLAAKELGVSRTTISAICLGQKIQTCGLTFRYL